MKAAGIFARLLVKEKRIDNEKELSEVKWTDILKPGFRYII